MKTEIKRKDEEKFLKFKIADNACFDNPLTFDEIIEYISMGILPLEVSEDDGTKVLDEEQFEEIKRVVPFLLKIIDKPRSFIKSLEETPGDFPPYELSFEKVEEMIIGKVIFCGKTI